MRNISGVHCQMSATITEKSAMFGSESQGTLIVPVRCRTSWKKNVRTPLIGPWVWKSM